MSTSLPENKPDANRVKAKSEMINPTAALLTPKDRVNSGIAGTMIPKPTATKNEATTRTLTSRGRSRSGDWNFIIRHPVPEIFSIFLYFHSQGNKFTA